MSSDSCLKVLGHDIKMLCIEAKCTYLKNRAGLILHIENYKGEICIVTVLDHYGCMSVCVSHIYGVRYACMWLWEVFL